MCRGQILPVMLFLPPNWRSFRDIPADAEAAFAASSSRFSLCTLEVVCDPGFPGFALTEKRHLDVWRWALISAEGPVIDEGWEPTEIDAKKSAVGAMRQAISQCSRLGSSEPQELSGAK